MCMKKTKDITCVYHPKRESYLKDAQERTCFLYSCSRSPIHVILERIDVTFARLETKRIPSLLLILARIRRERIFASSTNGSTCAPAGLEQPYQSETNRSDSKTLASHPSLPGCIASCPRARFFDAQETRVDSRIIYPTYSGVLFCRMESHNGIACVRHYFGIRPRSGWILKLFRQLFRQMHFQNVKL